MKRKVQKRHRYNPILSFSNLADTVGALARRFLQSAGVKLVYGGGLFGCQHRIGGFDMPSICQLDPGKRECDLPVAPGWCPLNVECAECGHSRDEHCGCGKHCLAPLNDEERKKDEKTGRCAPCKCSGWRSKV